MTMSKMKIKIGMSVWNCTDINVHERAPAPELYLSMLSAAAASAMLCRHDASLYLAPTIYTNIACHPSVCMCVCVWSFHLACDIVWHRCSGLSVPHTHTHNSCCAVCVQCTVCIDVSIIIIIL